MKNIKCIFTQHKFNYKIACKIMINNCENLVLTNFRTKKKIIKA